MAEYDIKKIEYFKKLLKNRVDYWESGLPVDFCIARRTRDILVSRSIVDNFQKSKTSGNLKGHLDFALSTVWQEYFQTYVQNVATIGEFLAIFIKFILVPHDIIWIVITKSLWIYIFEIVSQECI